MEGNKNLDSEWMEKTGSSPDFADFARQLAYDKSSYYGNGSYYKGEFVDGKFQGQGIEYCHIKHQTFVGEFYNDGQLKGEWKHGRVEN